MSRRRRIVYIAIALVVIASAALAGALPRLRLNALVRRETDDLAVPYVTVVRPQRAPLARELVLPGNVQAFAEAPIFARASGYVERWYTDIGKRVKRGQLLAVISAPDVDQQVEQAKGVLATSEANLALAQITEKRFAEAVKQNAVSKQDYDTAVGNRAADEATVAANRGNLGQLEQLQAFQKVVAPFDGTITARNIDIGDLVTAGSSTTTGPELFHIVQADTLRVFVSVPEAYAASAVPGLIAELALVSAPGRRVFGALVRTANAIDTTTRTLNVEIDVDNRNGALLAGAYAAVHIKLPPGEPVFIIPVEALVFRDKLQVATVHAGAVALEQITPGRDFGDRIEVTHGITADDQVILNPPDSITEGQRVRIAPPKQPQPQPQRR